MAFFVTGLVCEDELVSQDNSNVGRLLTAREKNQSVRHQYSENIKPLRCTGCSSIPSRLITKTQHFHEAVYLCSYVFFTTLVFKSVNFPLSMN